MQAALQKGGAAGISGSGAARGLVARDLGLTSLGVEQQRIAQAQDAGAKKATLGLEGQKLRLQDLVARGQLTQAAANAEAQRLGLVTTLIDARALPESGLNPGSIASILVGGNNAQNQFDTLNSAIAQQQKNANLNSLLGFGTTAASSGALSGIASLFKSKTPAIGGGEGFD